MRSLRWFATVLIFFVGSMAYASPASAVLFRGVKTSLGQRDREAIATQVGLTLSNDKKSFVDEAGNTLMIEVRELHLNADRVPEVLVIISGSTFMFGSTGSGVQLYVKGSSGHYVMNLGFPGADVKYCRRERRGTGTCRSPVLGSSVRCGGGTGASMTTATRSNASRYDVTRSAGAVRG